jgi:hypothetical protein
MRESLVEHAGLIHDTGSLTSEIGLMSTHDTTCTSDHFQFLHDERRHEHTTLTQSKRFMLHYASPPDCALPCQTVWSPINHSCKFFVFHHNERFVLRK